MAFSANTARGSNSSSVSHASLAVSPTAALTVGKVIFVSCVSDNLTTVEGPSTYHLVTDTDGHTWTRVFERTDTAGAAADGSTTSLWVTKVTTEIGTGDSITNTYQGGNNEAGLITIVEVTVGAGQTVNWQTPAHTHVDTLANDEISAVLSGLTSREYLFFGLLGGEGNDQAKTPIANYTEHFDIRTGPSGLAEVSIHVATRILTGTGDTWTSFSVSLDNIVQSLVAFYEVAEGGGSPQGLTGTLFTKAPTFNTGAITSVRNLAGVLFTKAPTFSTGTITATRTLTGVLFQKAPTFFAGAFDAGPAFLTGTLFTKAPTFFVGGIIESQALAGVLFQKAPTFSQGAVTVGAAPLDGVLYQNTPLFSQGSLTSLADLDGVLFQNTPVFFAGTVTPGEVEVTGVLFENTPVFNAGVLFQQGGPQPLGGDLYVNTPTFPQGSITTGAVDLAGVLFQQAPTFFAGAIGFNLSGVLYQNSPVFPQGDVVGAQLLDGVLFQSTPVFPAGSIGVAGAIDGVLYQNTPVFFTGSLGQVGGSFWRPNPAGYTLNPVAFVVNGAAYDPVLRDELPPWAIEVHGELFEKAPTFLVGALS